MKNKKHKVKAISGFGISKGVVPFSEESRFKGQLEKRKNKNSFKR